jgi:hypothetical protein
MSWLGDKMWGSKSSIDLNQIREYMAPTQGLVDEQVGISRQLMDPQSAINMQMRRMMAQRASETGAQTAQSMSQVSAMRNVSPGQAMMQSRMAQNQATGGVNQHWLQGVQNRFGQGVGLMGDMTGMQQGLNENMANAYIQNINAANAARAQRQGMTMGLVGAGLEFGASSLASSIPTMQEKVQKASQNYWIEKDQAMNPTFRLGGTGDLSYRGTPSGFSDDTGEASFSTEDFKVRTLTEEWNDYVKNLRDKGLRMRPNEYAMFAEQFAGKSEQWGINIANKFERMRLSGVSKSRIRELVASNPSLLQNLAKMSAINPAAYASISEYLIPGKGVLPGLVDEASNIAGATTPLLASGAIRGGLALRSPGQVFDEATGKFGKRGRLATFRRGFARGAMPGAGLERAMGRRALGAGLGGKRVAKNIENLMSKKGIPGANVLKSKRLKAEKVLKKAQEKYSDAAKKYNYKGKKRIKGKNFSATKDAKSLKKAREVAKKAVNKTYAAGTNKKTAVKAIRGLVKKFGVRGLISQVAKKAGWKTALFLGARLAGGTALMGTGIGTAAGFALDIWTISSILKILGDVGKEAGGFRAPQKMLFGGEDPSRAYGATF